MSTRHQFPVLLSVDISETENTYLIEADITGFRAENVNVKPWQDSLIIEMHTGQEQTESYYLGEPQPEYYRRVIPLGFRISNKCFETQYIAGNLKIYVRKPANHARIFVSGIQYPLLSSGSYLENR